MAIPDAPKPRLLRAVSPTLRAYFRVGRDHLALQALLASDRQNFTGLPHGLLNNPVYHVGLDPNAFELSTMRGPLNQKLAALAWAGTQLPHDSRRLRGAGAEWMTALIADEVAGRSYSAVLNPTHLLSSVDDEWLSVDIELAGNLRRALDQSAATPRRHATCIASGSRSSASGPAPPGLR